MQVSKYLVRARVLVAALPLITALTAALMGVAVLAFGASPAAAQEQTGGAVVAWGYNGYGQTNVPSGLGSVKAISAGLFHSMALKEDGTVVAWGYNGQVRATSRPAWVA